MIRCVARGAEHTCGVADEDEKTEDARAAVLSSATSSAMSSFGGDCLTSTKVALTALTRGMRPIFQVDAPWKAPALASQMALAFHDDCSRGS